jgi:hypothetical protein
MCSPLSLTWYSDCWRSRFSSVTGLYWAGVRNAVGLSDGDLARPVMVLASPEHPTELLQCGLPEVGCSPPLVTARGESFGGAVQHVDTRVIMT